MIWKTYWGVEIAKSVLCKIKLLRYSIQQFSSNRIANLGASAKKSKFVRVCASFFASLNFLNRSPAGQTFGGLGWWSQQIEGSVCGDEIAFFLLIRKFFGNWGGEIKFLWAFSCFSKFEKEFRFIGWVCVVDLKNDFLGFKKAAQKYGKALFRCGAELSEISFVNYPAVAAKYATYLKYRERLEHN